MKAAFSYLGTAVYILILSVLFAVGVVAFTVTGVSLLGAIG